MSRKFNFIGRNTHSYAISSAGACVNRGAVLLSKGVQGLTTTQRGLPIVQSFRRAQTLIANHSVKAFANGACFFFIESAENVRRARITEVLSAIEGSAKLLFPRRFREAD